jgi:hypothetical protein
MRWALLSSISVLLGNIILLYSQRVVHKSLIEGNRSCLEGLHLCIVKARANTVRTPTSTLQNVNVPRNQGYSKILELIMFQPF